MSIGEFLQLSWNTAFHLSFSTPQKSYGIKSVDFTNGNEELIQKDPTTKVTRDTKSPLCYYYKKNHVIINKQNKFFFRKKKIN